MAGNNDDEKADCFDIKVACFEAFTDVPGKGNPAGVVFDADDLTDIRMQRIAAKVGFNETAFLLKSDAADFRLRYFTPGHEMNLCGHGTIASVCGLMKRRHVTSSQHIRLETRAGILDVHYEDENQEVLMNQAPAEFIDFRGDLEQLADAIGLHYDDIDIKYPCVYGSTGIWTLILPIKDLRAFSRMNPNNSRFRDILTQKPESSVHPICMETYDPACTMHGRHFSASHSGTTEDSVTGTASGVMGAYYISYIHPSDQARILVEQGNEIGREGVVKVYASREKSQINVSISGKAVYGRDIIVSV